MQPYEPSGRTKSDSVDDGEDDLENAPDIVIRCTPVVSFRIGKVNHGGREVEDLNGEVVRGGHCQSRKSRP